MQAEKNQLTDSKGFDSLLNLDCFVSDLVSNFAPKGAVLKASLKKIGSQIVHANTLPKSRPNGGPRGATKDPTSLSGARKSQRLKLKLYVVGQKIAVSFSGNETQAPVFILRH